MMLFKSRVPYLFLSLFVSFSAAAQNDKLSIVFQPFHVSATAGKEQAPALYEMTLNQLMELNKFTLVNRTAEMWKAIEDELKVQDFIDPTTAVNLGKMSGAKFLLMGDLSSFSTERKVKTTTDNKVDYYFTSSVAASLKLIDLETGQYKESVLSEITVDHADRESSIRQALQRASSDLVSKLSKKFLLHANIKGLQSQESIYINKGSQDGVKLFAAFHVMDTQQEPSVKLATIKITSVSMTESTGRLLNGNFTKLAIGNEVIESPEYEANVIAVESKTKNMVTINGGSNLNIKKGDIFSLSQEGVTGRIYIKEVKSDRAVGKILEGNKNIEPGVTLSESDKDQIVKRSFIGFNFKSGLGIKINPTISSGIVSFTNRNGDYDIDTEYLDQYKTISQVNVYSLNFGAKNLVRDITTSLNFDIYDMSPLKTWISHLDILYEHALVQDKLYFAFGGGIGYGRLKQTVPDNVIEAVSNGESTDVRAHSVFVSGMVDLRYTIKRVVVHAGVSYDFMRFKKWKYTVDDDGEEVTEIAPTQIVPYHDVNVSGLYYKVGIAYVYRK